MEKGNRNICTAKVSNKYPVTVVMATYNGEKYLSEQLESIMAQKGVDLNVLVRDDGSTDGTIRILNDYQDKGLLKWYTGEHLGVQNGYLDLLRHAQKTHYYAFSDQDDVWDEEKLKNAINMLESFPANIPLIYYSGQMLVDENLDFIAEHKIDSNRSAHTNFLISNIAGCTAVFNNILVEKINEVTPKYILMHDSWIFKVCIALGGQYYADSKSYIKYRQHGSNVTGINKGLKSKFHQAKRYIYEFQIQKQIESLLNCYECQMTPDYKILSHVICNYNKSWKNWLALLLCKDFDFKNLMLNSVVRLKIILKKL